MPPQPLSSGVLTVSTEHLQRSVADAEARVRGEGLPAGLTPITSAHEPVLSLAAGGARLQRVKKIDWSSVDWRKPVRQIAKELGCSRQAVYLAQARRWGQA